MPTNRDVVLLGLLALAAVGVSGCSSSDPHRESDGLCGYQLSAVGLELSRGDSRNTIQWTPDGSRILFDFAEDILVTESFFGDVPDLYAVHVSGDQVHKVLDLHSLRPEYHIGDQWMTFDLSADGSRIAYAKCAVSKEKVQGVDGDWQVDNSEIFVSNIDGSRVNRLTNNTYADALPAWSPDGKNLAFVSDPNRSTVRGIRPFIGAYLVWEATTRITIHEVATGESREIGLPEGYAAAPIRLEWSPSGDRIAFVVLEGETSPWNLAVYVVGADGTGLTRVSDAASGPTWSPDGDSIAMIVPEENGEEALFTFAADGSNSVKVNSDIGSNVGGWRGTSIGTGSWMGNLSWSPDGSEAAILIERFTGGGRPAVIPLEIGGVESGISGDSHAQSRAVTAGAGRGSILASPPADSYARHRRSMWSPDGALIAMREDIAEFVSLYVVDPKGNTRVLLEWEKDFR